MWRRGAGQCSKVQVRLVEERAGNNSRARERLLKTVIIR